MNYQATERLARAIGRDGVYDRERLYEYYIGQGMDEKNIGARSWVHSNKQKPPKVKKHEGDKKRDESGGPSVQTSHQASTQSRTSESERG